MVSSYWACRFLLYLIPMFHVTIFAVKIPVPELKKFRLSPEACKKSSQLSLMILGETLLIVCLLRKLSVDPL